METNRLRYPHVRPITMRLPARLQFGDCVFDRDARTLTRHNAPVHLTPKAYRLLELLLRPDEHWYRLRPA